MNAPIRIAFVCSGNICRSPYAEALLARAAGEEPWRGRVVSESVGTYRIEGQPAHPLTLRIAAEQELSLLSFRSRGADAERVAEVDLLVALSPDHVTWLRETHRDSTTPVWLITAPGIPDPPEGDEGVPDPVGFEEAEYRASLGAIERVFPDLLRAIAEHFGLPDHPRAAAPPPSP